MTREEAIELLKQHKMESEEDYWLRRAEALGLAIEALENQKTGHWIDTGSGQECSECGEIQYGYDSFRYFCTKCGSKMEGKIVE